MSALELQLKTSVILAELKKLQGVVANTQLVMREAAAEIDRLRAENTLLLARLRIAKAPRLDFDLSADDMPSLLRPQI